MDRMVVFASDRVLHRVLPSNKERYCFTVWLDGAHTNPDEEIFLRERHLQLVHDDVVSAAAFFQASPLQRLLSRAVYEDQYEQSLKECMQDAPGGALMLEAHSEHMIAHRKNPAMVQCVTIIQKYAHIEPKAFSSQQDEVDDSESDDSCVMAGEVDDFADLMDECDEALQSSQAVQPEATREKPAWNFSTLQGDTQLRGLSADSRLQLQQKQEEETSHRKFEATGRIKSRIGASEGEGVDVAEMLAAMRLEGYSMTFEEYDYHQVSQLRALGTERLRQTLEELGVTVDDAHRIEIVVFS